MAPENDDLFPATGEPTDSMTAPDAPASGDGAAGGASLAEETPAPTIDDSEAGAPVRKRAATKRATAKKAAAKTAAPRKRAARKSAAAAPAESPEDRTEDLTEDLTQDLTEDLTQDLTADLTRIADENADEAERLAVDTATTQPTTEEAAAEPSSAETRPAVQTFGVLFQPPEIPAAPARPARGQARWPEPVEVIEEVDAEEEAAPTGPDEETDESFGEDGRDGGRRRRRRGGRGRRARAGEEESGPDRPGADQPRDGQAADADRDGSDREAEADSTEEVEEGAGGSSRRRRRRRRGEQGSGQSEDPPGTVTKIREPRTARDEPVAVKGSTRLEAKKQRRREGREAGRRRTVITEAEFLARRESVERVMVVRGDEERTQIAVLEDGVLVEHYISRESSTSMAGNVYLGRVQNVLPSMEAAFVDIGKGRNAVLYAGEVNWDAAGLESGEAKRIENALSSGESVLVQVTKDPIGHKGARLTSQISLPGRYLVYVPEGRMTGISRKLPDTERARLKAILKEVVPENAGVIVRTAAEGASEEELRADVARLTAQWDRIKQKADAKSGKKASGGGAPALLSAEPDLTVRVIRDIFNEDFSSLVVAGGPAWEEVSEYVHGVAPDLAPRLQKWTSEDDLFTHYRVDEQIAKAMDRKVWLPSGGSLVIDRTEAMTVVDVNTGKFVGSGGNLEETVTRNNIEAAEEIVRQLRLRDIGGIIVIDFIDMVLESNRDLVVRRLLECLGRDRTKHQVAEVTSLGLVQMTRKRVGSGLIEVFSEPCEHCGGRGLIIHTDPVERSGGNGSGQGGSTVSGAVAGSSSAGRSRGRRGRAQQEEAAPTPPTPSGPTPAQIAAAAHAAAIKQVSGEPSDDDVADLAAATATSQDGPLEVVRESDTDSQPAASDHGEAAAPEVAEAPTAVAPPAEARTAEAPSVEAPLPAPAAVEPPKRRKRGRVTAPAGPPKAAAAALTAATPQPEGLTTAPVDAASEGSSGAPSDAPADAVADSHPEAATSTPE